MSCTPGSMRSLPGSRRDEGKSWKGKEMMKRKSRLVVMGVTAVLAMFGTTLSGMAAEDVDPPKGKLEEFEFTALDGEQYGPEIFEDVDVSIINIWGTYCGPCIREMPALAGLSKSLPERVKFYTLCIDGKGQEEAVLDFMESCGFEDPSCAIVDFDGDIIEMLSQVLYVPTTVTVDSKGNLLGSYVIGSPVNVTETYTQCVNDALTELELPLLDEEEEACTEGLTE